MSHTDRGDSAVTRSRFLRTTLAGGAVIAGGAALGAARDDDGPLAASPENDRRILGLFLLLEQAQEAFYRRAVEEDRIGDLVAVANAISGQEAAHAAFLKQQLGSAARPFRAPDPGAKVDSRSAFLTNAIALEELAIAAYVGQGAALSRRLISRIGELTSVEGRQAAWLRDLARIMPAPRAADQARTAQAITADLRRRRFIA